MKKKVISLLLALCLVVCYVPMSVFAAEVVAEGTCGENLTWVFTDDGTLTISGEGEMEGPSFMQDYRESIVHVIVGDGVTSICNKAFNYCFALDDVEISNSVVSIGECAFQNCTRLTSVTFGNSVTTIGDWAFDGCSSLTSLAIPESVTSIGNYAFSGLESATGIYVDENNPNYSSDDCGVLFDKEKSQLIQAPGALSGDYSIPASVTSIGAWAFDGCTGLTGITIPDGVTMIERSAFLECIGLNSVVVPDSVTDIKSHAFYHCGNLTRVVIGNGVTSVGIMAFAYCGNLNDLTIGNSVASIGQDAFLDCNMTSVVIPDSVTSIGDAAFASCDSLTAIKFLGDAPSIGSSALSEVSATVYYPANNSTWTEDVMQQYRGTITWIPYDPSEPEETEPTEPSTPEETEPVETEPVETEPVETEPVATEPEETEPTAPTPTEPSTPEETEPTEPEETEPSDSTPAEPVENPFTDVKSTAYYYEPVLWAVENNITGGTSATTFSPNASCTRGQIVTFLWAAAGRPEPKSANNPFTDVKSSAYYYKAVLWAVENGITSGTSATTFSPNNTCTRGQVVTFLWAAKGRPEPETTSNSFSDVKSSDYYYRAVLWAVENGITSGVGNGKFGPSQTCTRGQIVTFLYKAFA